MLLRFCKHFHALDTTILLIDTFSSEVDKPATQVIKQWKSHSIAVLQEDFIPAKDDYNELNHLCCIFRGENFFFIF